jgi:hypothetical protein
MAVMKRSPATAAPTPIPALAPVESSLEVPAGGTAVLVDVD